VHAAERDKAILSLLAQNDGFIAFRKLEQQVKASPATLRRDLARLADEGLVERVRGGARLPDGAFRRAADNGDHLLGVPLRENLQRMPEEKAAIARVATTLCKDGTLVMIDGGSTTLQMCQHLAGRNLQVFTNSLPIVSTLLKLGGTRILVPGGSVFPEQNIILSAVGDEAMPRFHAPQFFMSATSIGPQGVMQPDVILVAAERRLIDRADELIVLVDHTKFRGPSGNVVCGLDEVATVVTDVGVNDKDVAMLEAAGVRVVIAGIDS
jgi:DeoR family ulaG and ulaABCDEF operon transcriptional repressor